MTHVHNATRAPELPDLMDERACLDWLDAVQPRDDESIAAASRRVLDAQMRMLRALLRVLRHNAKTLSTVTP